ncbi:MAG: hypothetical protein D6714_21665, partial [Bacteroidetes bacterium]
TQPEQVSRQKEIDFARSDYARESAEDRNIIDYVQIKYAGAREKLSFGREWTLGAGFRIPLKNNNKLKLNELELDRLDAENDLRQFQIQTAERIRRAHYRLESLFGQYEQLEAQMRDSQARFVLSKISPSTPSDALLILKIKRNEIRQAEKLSKIRWDIFREYVRLLDLTGQLSELPLRNFLSVGKEPL